MMDFLWLSGMWVGSVWGGRMEETWSVPSGGLMLGTNRVVVEGKSSFREFLSIDIAESRATMRVYVVRDLEGPVEPVAYGMADGGLTWARFENLEHERLSRITYRREGDRLTIALQGIRKGSPSEQEIALERV